MQKKKCLNDISHQVVDEFLSNTFCTRSYENLFSLFLRRYLLSIRSSNSLAFYPGYPSCYGVLQEGIEGFTRFLPCISCWLASGRSPWVTPAGCNDAVNIADIALNGIIDATNPLSEGYYGRITDNDSRIIAACLIGISLWIAKSQLWDFFQPSEKTQVSSWLLEANKCKVTDNNWHLFIVMINVVLKQLSSQYDATQLKFHYIRHKSFYVGDGFYTDGPNGYFDYYNAWEVHPFLILLNAIDPEFDSVFIKETTGLFLHNFSHFFTPTGFPIFGRSICYRLALPTPLLLASFYTWDNVDYGLAASTFDATWRHFASHGAIESGLITPGYYKANPSFLDEYSGPASANWSLWSLAVALLFEQDNPFWKTSPLPPLEVSRGSFSLTMKHLNMTVIGDHTTGVVKLRFHGTNKFEFFPTNQYRQIADKFIDLFYNSGTIARHLWFHMPYKIRRVFARPENKIVKYNLSVYRSDLPFCEKYMRKDNKI